MSKNTVPTSADYFDEIEASFQLGPEHRAVLVLCREAFARYREIKDELDRTGVMVEGRYEGVSRISPMVAAEARARESLARLIRSLNLGG